MKLIFSSDHAGFKLKDRLMQRARELGHDCVEAGAVSEEAYDYPDAADEIIQSILQEETDLGVLICGTGIGISIRANRYKGIRAANCCSAEMARLAREHNHANVLCLGQRLVEEREAERILEAFLNSSEGTDSRHQRRVEKLDGPTAP